MTMSVNEIDALRARIAQCWSPPPGGLGADQIVIKLRLKLNEDGTLVGFRPSPMAAHRRSSRRPPTARCARCIQCQPYDAAQRQICALARHDPQFRPKRDVSQRLSGPNHMLPRQAKIPTHPIAFGKNRRSRAWRWRCSRLAPRCSPAAGSRRGRAQHHPRHDPAAADRHSPTSSATARSIPRPRARSRMWWRAIFASSGLFAPIDQAAFIEKGVGTRQRAALRGLAGAQRAGAGGRPHRRQRRQAQGRVPAVGRVRRQAARRRAVLRPAEGCAAHRPHHRRHDL